MKKGSPFATLASIILIAGLVACGGGSAATPARAVWQANAPDTFHLQLKGALVTNVAASIYDIDLFDTSAAQIVQLKQQGRKVVCYFSAGSSENWRADFNSFLPADMGNPLSGWPGENWLDTRSGNVRSIMLKRMDIAVNKGCDGIDPDNVNGYTNPTGFNLTAQDQLDFNRFLSSQAHSRGLAIGLKNDIAQLGQLAGSFEFAVNEQCHQYFECAGYQAFASLGKPVLNVEYSSSYVSNTGSGFTTTGAYTTLCATAATEKLQTQALPLLLDGSYRFSCN
ncbi:MAG: endo alpha-1,4 polygalactosaminidase [Nitrosomonadales bacterium]|nr:endo alpha-1,4 polygalactosaminidase [Nitrosomonadales bacterium]